MRLTADNRKLPTKHRRSCRKNPEKPAIMRKAIQQLIDFKGITCVFNRRDTRARSLLTIYIGKVGFEHGTHGTFKLRWSRNRRAGLECALDIAWFDLYRIAVALGRFMACAQAACAQSCGWMQSANGLAAPWPLSRICNAAEHLQAAIRFALFASTEGFLGKRSFAGPIMTLTPSHDALENTSVLL